MIREKNANDQLLIVPRVVWGALCLSNLVYAQVLGMVTPMPDPESGFTVMDTLSKSPNRELAFVSIVLLVVSRVLPTFLKNQILQKKGPALDFKEAVARFFVPFVLGMALLEAASLMGFVIAFTAKNPQVYYIFGLVALVNQLIRFPREQTVRDASGLQAQSN